eukprot:TRINITY_DN9984_c0_g1_i1.p1 TRINITY_DN9984_c0_g1~~TRINITY_DN9984_c0_g1_i1.p1  ORF type:complete len:270 (-),score=65.09 TRINITY_DN9984_c0_g1_i1:51-860(-)
MEPNPELPQAAASTTPVKVKKIKPYHRVHPHSNPLADKDFPYPLSPLDARQRKWWDAIFDFAPLPPAEGFTSERNMKKVDNVDIGCGYGGLTVSLSQTFPEEVTLAMEIRQNVVEYVEQRIKKLREEHPTKYQNISVLKCNCMKNLPNFFEKGQLKRLFFLFPDPHFKKCNVRRRIISPILLSEYAHVLCEGGVAYTITDVEDLHKWMVACFDAHPMFKRIPDEEAMKDPAVPLIFSESEEAKKVERAGGKKYLAVYRRVQSTPLDFEI